MKTVWLKQEKNEFLLLFCNGWGMDSLPFLPLTSKKYDILACYDYSEGYVEVDLENLAAGYAKMYLLSWSMGVYFSQVYFAEKSYHFDSCIAINGTLCPIDDCLGIPRDVFSATLEQMSEVSVLKFYRRMCRDRQFFATFLAHRPQRSLPGLEKELRAISQTAQCLGEENSIFTDIIISKSDFIMPTVNQLRFWRNSTVHMIEGYHFPFYRWHSWDEIVESVT